VIDEAASVGFLAAPGIIAAILQVFRPFIVGRLSSDWLPPLALVLGVGYGLLAWQSGLMDASNIVVAGMLGIVVGLAASGAIEVQRHYRDRS
jgi:hypothetical protein